MHRPEDFEKWLLPYLQEKVDAYPFDYRTIANGLDENILRTVTLLNIDSVLFMKGELVGTKTVEALNEVGIKTGCWTIDDHAHPEYFQKPFTHIWTPSPKLIPEYEKRCKNVHELAFYVEPYIFTQPLTDGKPYDVTFLGTRYDGREDRITRLRDAGVDVRVFGDQWNIQNEGRIQEYVDCLRLWRSTKVNLAIHQTSMRQAGALNTKMYEVPAAGGFLLCDYFPEITAKFNADEVAWYDPDDDGSLLKWTKWYLENGEYRRDVMERARKRVFSDHTAEKRAEQILREFK